MQESNEMILKTNEIKTAINYSNLLERRGMSPFLSYSGIGSRNIHNEEEQAILEIADFLRRHAIVYSGNANGSDITFQKGSQGRCVVMLPYKNFNTNNYNAWEDSLDAYDMGKSEIGELLTDQLHPAPFALNWKSKPFMNRNAHQVLGHEKYPMVSFIVCCSNVDELGNVVGGTGQACRIAHLLNIPVINIREEKDYMDKIKEIIKRYRNF